MGDGLFFDGHLGVDSALIAVVDATVVDDFLAAVEGYLDGAQYLDAPVLTEAGGLLVDTGGDGQFLFEGIVGGGVLTGFQVVCGDGPLDPELWQPAGAIEVASGVLLVGDPDFLFEYVLDPFELPYEVYPVWAVGQLPGPGWIDLGFVADPETSGVRAVRGDWRPGETAGVSRTSRR